MRTFFFVLIVAMAVYLFVEGPAEILQTVGLDGGRGTSQNSQVAPSEALTYAKRYVGHSCRMKQGNTLTCHVKNRGAKELYSVTVEVSASTGGQANAQSYALLLYGPFQAKSDATVSAEIPADESINWLANRSVLIDAAF